MTGAILAALWGQWRRAPLQLFTLVAGLALATALWSGVQAINAEARASYDAAAATLGEGRFAQVVSADGLPIPVETYVALRRAGWQVSPVVEGRINGVRIVGLDPLTAPGGLGPVSLGEGADLGAFLSGHGQLFGTAEALAALDAPGPELVVAPDVAPGTVVTDIGVAQQLLGARGLSRLIVAEEQPMGLPPLEEVAPGLVLRAGQGGTDIGRLTDSFHLNLTAFGLLAFAVGLFIVNGAIGLVFEQRRGLVRTLRALGVPLRRLVVLMAADLAALALLAGVLGIVLGYFVAAALLPDVAATLRGLYGAQVSGDLSLRPGWWASGLVIALAGTVMAGSGALWRIARMPLLSAGASRAWAVSSGRTRRVATLAGVGLLAIAAGIAGFGQGLVAGFACLGALLTGAALMLPAGLDASLRLAQRRARGVRAEWFWADTRAQVPGLGLALMALLLAMAANVGVSTMVSSFRTTFVEFLDQRLASELYVDAESPAQAAEVVAFAEAEGLRLLPILSVERELAGLPGELFGARDDPTYAENWRFLSASEDPWGQVHAGEGVVINEQLARRQGLSLGDRIAVAPGVTLPVVGIYGDYGNPVGQAVITERLFRAHYPQVAPTRFGLRIPGDVEAMRQRLVAETSLSMGATINQDGIKAFSLGVFDRTFTVTGALNVLTLAVAGFAILMSLLTLAALRLPQLAPVWALGLTRAELGRLELVRAVVLAALTTALAVPLGLVLAWVLLAFVNVEAFGWRLPMFLFPADYARLGLFAVVAAALAAAWPAWRLARTPPRALLGVFANER